MVRWGGDSKSREFESGGSREIWIGLVEIKEECVLFGIYLVLRNRKFKLVYIIRYFCFFSNKTFEGKVISGFILFYYL